MLSTLKIFFVAKSTVTSFKKPPREIDKKQRLGKFFRCRNLTKIITACLLFQERLNPWKAICFMFNPFPKGVFSMELSSDFPFLMLKKQLLHIIYPVFIMSSQTLKCIKLLSQRSLLISPRSVYFSLGAA